jgi:hypothetical protein
MVRLFKILKCRNSVAMNRTAPAAKRAQTKCVRETEEQRTRRAYLEKPDSEAEADDWSSAGEWKP